MTTIETPKDEIVRKVAKVPFWWHSISLAPGTTTPGFKSAEHLSQELKSFRLPPLAGKTVLDIGAWDGFYSFEAERQGAKRVVALDHYAWSIDWKTATQYPEECKRKGITPSHEEGFRKAWKPDLLPGKKGFDTAREILQSKVEPVVGDFSAMDLKPLGQFDVVFFLGVLYHMKNPFEAVERLAGVTREVAVIETEAIFLPGPEAHAFFHFS